MVLLHVFLGCMLFFKFFHHEHLSVITIMGVSLVLVLVLVDYC
jgi:hypothetical protein